MIQKHPAAVRLSGGDASVQVSEVNFAFAFNLQRFKVHSRSAWSSFLGFYQHSSSLTYILAFIIKIFRGWGLDTRNMGNTASAENVSCLLDCVLTACCGKSSPPSTDEVACRGESSSQPSTDEVACRGESSSQLSTDVEVAVQETSEYFSPRIAAMIQTTDHFSSDVEHEIAFSKSHWSELRGSSRTPPSDDSSSSSSNDEQKTLNRKLFEELRNDPQWTHPGGGFFMSLPGLKPGEKIAEGAQAEIFECVHLDGSPVTTDGGLFTLLKVFKKGCALSQLRQQWPLGLLRGEILGTHSTVLKGTMLDDDGRFAFILWRCWGDLRKLIDVAMIANHNQRPPFPVVWDGKQVDAFHVMRDVARCMATLHAKGIVHRDLKASNILLVRHGMLILGDFECSVGVSGTGFWRAPEILLAMKNGDDAVVFTEKADVYSYGMTCFEIVTGRIPFEGELEPCGESYDLVIQGRRPTLPCGLHARVKDLITRCWDSDPENRPRSSEILTLLDDYFIYCIEKTILYDS